MFILLFDGHIVMYLDMLHIVFCFQGNLFCMVMSQYCIMI